MAKMSRSLNSNNGKEITEYRVDLMHKQAGCQQGVYCDGPGCNLHTGKTEAKRPVVIRRSSR